MNSLHFNVPFRAPYALRYHLEGSYAQRSFWLGDVPLVLRLSQAGDDGELTAEAFSDRDVTAHSGAIKAAARHMVAADDDLLEFHAAVAKDKKMMRLAEALPGLKPLRVPDIWTTLLRSLISQQVSTAAARAIRERFSRQHGHIVQVGTDDVSVVPSPAAVAALEESALRAVGFSGRKAEYAIGFARAFLNGTIDPAQLSAAPPEQMIERLSSLRGVGVWTAECVGIFCIGYRDLLPADDLGIQHSIEQLYKLDHCPKPKEVTRIGKKWSGWRSYAAIYLWGARNHGVLPTRVKAANKERAAASATRSPRKTPNLPARRTGAKLHSPAPPGRRGR
jgi:DNA-3-methyladenine glycosylase II